MFKNLIVICTALLISGCSYSRVTYKTQPEVSHVNEQHEAFVRFVVFMHKNANVKPNEKLKSELNILLTEAGLRRECTDKNGCYLVYNNVKISISGEFIHIENVDKSYIKVDDARVAAKYIYG